MSRHRSFATAIAALILASPLAAQSVSADTSALSSAAAAPTPAPVLTRATPDPLVPLSPARVQGWSNVDAGARSSARTVWAGSYTESQGPKSVAMMVVGGAGLLVGAVVGGKAGGAIMAGGGVLGLIGLWNYLK
jgi:hypothetical protein